MDYIGLLIVWSLIVFMVSYIYHRAKAGLPVEDKFISRKFMAAFVATGYTIAAQLGLDTPTDQVVLVDLTALLYAVIQGIKDVKVAKANDIPAGGSG